LATLDNLTADSKKKKLGGMGAAVAGTEKIRSWVSIRRLTTL
jgi:hypothetical protein